MHHFLTKTGIPEVLQKQWENKPGFKKSQSLHEHIRKFYLLPNFLSDKEKREYLKSFRLVIFGRHPFIRLVSTYKDKLIDHDDHPWKKLMKYDKNHPFSVIFCTFLSN